MVFERAPYGSGIAIALLAVWLAAGCAESAGPGPDGAPSGLDATASASDAGTRPTDAEPEPEPDAAPRPLPDAAPATSCAGIRNCIVRCQLDTTCAQRCVDQAAAPARTGYQQIVTCSRQVCAADDINCRCERECQGGGECLDLVDGCRGVEEDLFCDELCM